VRRLQPLESRASSFFLFLLVGEYSEYVNFGGTEDGIQDGMTDFFHVKGNTVFARVRLTNHAPPFFFPRP